jgi:Uma2 family endonuclease
MLAGLEPSGQRGRAGGGGKGGSWRLLFEPELHLGDAILLPDLVGWRLERMPVVPDTAFCTLAPDRVCEVLFKSTRSIDRYTKMPEYAKAGVAWVWLLDVEAQALEPYELVPDGVLQRRREPECEPRRSFRYRRKKRSSNRAPEN